jgi:hypothetical protein
MRAVTSEFPIKTGRISLLIVSLLLSAGSVPAGAEAQTSTAQSTPSAQSSVALPREVLERYVGRYALNGTVATVSLTDDGQLTVQLEGQPPGPPLRAVSANEFVADAAGVRLIFEGEGPKATRIRSQYGGSEVVGTRIADGAAAAPTSLDAAARKEVVDALGTALRQRYVFPDVGEKAASRIEAALAAGEYDNLSDRAAFAARLDADVSAIAHDEHMRVISLSGPPPGPPPGAMGPPSAEAGVVRADRLAGGVGYVEIIGFPPLPAFKPAIDRAMTALKGSKALFLDDRRNGGGDPAAVAYAVSFLVPPDRHLHISDIVARTAGTTEFTRLGTDSQPTPVSFAGIPVYVLTSHETFSGGEEFAYDVQTHRLGKIVGEVTGGGANPTGPVPLGDGFIAAIPFGRSENPVTKANWEGRGVQPDVAVPAADALKKARQRLGQPPVADVAAASRQQVFTPRSAPLPATEADGSVGPVMVEPALDGVFRTFGAHPIVALGDAHGLAEQMDFYAAVVRDPRFARDVRSVVVEFGASSQQQVIDRYLAGETVPYAELRKVWNDTIGWVPPPALVGFVKFFVAVRDVNKSLPPDRRIKVWLGEPPLDWTTASRGEIQAALNARDTYPAGLIRDEILAKGKKALVIYGAGHLAGGPMLKGLLDATNPGAMFAIMPYAPPLQYPNCAPLLPRVAAIWPTPALATRGPGEADAGVRRCFTLSLPMLGPVPGGPGPRGPGPAGPGPVGPGPAGPAPGGAGPPPLEGDGLLLLGPLEKLAQGSLPPPQMLAQGRVLPDYLFDPELRREMRRRSELGGLPVVPAPPGLAIRKADFAFDLEAPGFRELIEKIFAAYDRNRDGVITSDEYHDPLD